MKDSEYTALVRANNALTAKVKKSHNKPKTDCGFFGKATIIPSCQCLKELYCKVENCRFYKLDND